MSPIGGGAETWLMDVYRRIDRSRFRFDFLIHTPDRLPFHDEIEAMGGRLLRACRPLYLWKYGRVFRRLVAENGPYDICHAHIPYCGYALRLARTAGIPVRVAHSHMTSYSLGLSWPARQFLRGTNRWVSREATAGLACSRLAAAGLYGPDWERDPRWRVLHYGIDLTRFSGPVDGGRLRAELGIPPDAFVVGHVGRFQAQKNHEFLIRVAAEVFKRESRARLLLVGDGPDRTRIERQVRDLGIGDRVIFAGMRKDVPDLMRGAMDVFVLPSLFEGLPIVSLEAQAAGLPVVYADTITDELVVVPGLARSESLSSPPGVWAEALLAHRPPRPTRTDLEAHLGNELFSIEGTTRRLEQVYQEVAEPRGQGRTRGSAGHPPLAEGGEPGPVADRAP